jgi:hypothetical protein
VQSPALNQREDLTMAKYLLTASVVGAILVIIALAMSGKNCQVSRANTVGILTDGLAGNKILERHETHCLIYGKLCLGETLRGH